MKHALREGLKSWHGEQLEEHFETTAYGKYSAFYPARKKGGGRPLVFTGKLREVSLWSRNREVISGTSKHATMTIRFGRPKQWTEETLKVAIFAEMGKLKISYKAAERRVFSRAGYGKENQALFQRAMAATIEKDREAIGNAQLYAFLDFAQKNGRAKRQVIEA